MSLIITTTTTPLRRLAVVFVLAAAAVSTPALAVKHTGGEYNAMYAGLGAKDPQGFIAKASKNWPALNQ